MRTVTATRYVTPLREGGSLPAIVEADDGRSYVLKFRGAGQGPKALVAELVTGELARACGLPVPELVLVELDAALGRTEPDQEIQDLVRASAGLNLALAYLPGALAWEPALAPPPDGELAARVVWFDALTTNVDRTARNTNMLIWRRGLWLIDHGASLYFHHDWTEHLARARRPFAAIRQHVLLPLAASIADADARLAPVVDEATVRAVVAQVPDAWLLDEHSPAAMRDGYVAHLRARLEGPRAFAEEAERARAALHV